MSVLSLETRLVGTGLAVLPRVNLIPPEIEERRRFRQVQMGLGAAGLAAVGIVGLLLVAASSSVASANEDVARADARSAQLRSETAKFKDVTAVYARAAAAQAMLTTAMGEEVRYSRLLNDLSLRVPDKLWLTSVTFTQTPPTAVVAGASPAIGSVTFVGVGFSHDDVAVWLDSLAGQKGFQDPYFQSSTESFIGSKKVVNFNSTVSLTQAAYSGRYTKPAGG